MLPFADDLESFASVDDIQVYQNNSDYLYQLSGFNEAGEAITETVVIPIASIDKATNVLTTYACGCRVNGLTWKWVNGQMSCSAICYYFPN